MFRGVIAAAVACVACAPAMATVYTVSGTVQVPAGFENSSFGGTINFAPINSLAVGDVLDVTINLDPVLVRNAFPVGVNFPAGYLRAGLLFSGAPHRVGDATYEIGGATGGINVTSGTAIDIGPEADYWRYLQVANDRANYHGGSLTSIRLIYTVDEAVNTPLSRAFFDITVPEPATWAMMIIGFGAVGAAARRRRYSPASVRY